MSSTTPPLAKRRRTGSGILAALVVVFAVFGLVGLAGCSSPSASPSSQAAAPTVAVPAAHRSLERLPDTVFDDPPGQPHGAPHGLLTTADGHVPDGVTALDTTYPAVTTLNPALLAALRQATTAAANSGVELEINSGWRSRAYQQQLLDEAVSTYGSRAKAAQWVATPDTSPHVSGDAVDIGGQDAAAWLAQYGVRYGLCQIYQNEPWHFELRPNAVDHGCPPTYPDPTHDPRMQQ